MNRRKENKISMYFAVIKWYEEHQTTADTLPKFALTITNIKNDLLQIADIRIVMETNIKGTTKNKTITRDQLKLLTMNILVRLKAFALHSKNNELQAAVNFSQSNLRNSADTVMRDRCMLVAALAGQYVSQMTDYNLTQTMVDQLNNCNTEFFNLIPMPRLRISERKIKTASLDDVMQSVDSHLDDLDITASVKRFDDPPFYKSYLASRAIIDNRPKSKTREIKTGAKGTITDRLTQNPIPNARISAGIRRKPVFTDEKGRFILALKKGTHTLEITATDHQPLTLTVTITRSLLNKTNIILDRITQI